jgi:hypothetical protein
MAVERFGLSSTYLFLAIAMLIVSVLALFSKPMRNES